MSRTALPDAPPAAVPCLEITPVTYLNFNLPENQISELYMCSYPISVCNYVNTHYVDTLLIQEQKITWEFAQEMVYRSYLWEAVLGQRGLDF